MRKTAILLAIVLIASFAAPAMSQGITDNFWFRMGNDGTYTGGGSGYMDGTWYEYPSGWINVWFYDHPLDFTRGKIIVVEFDWVTLDPTYGSVITVAINWSTPAWSDLGYGDQYPPLPDMGDEYLYIERFTILDEQGYFPEPQHFVYDFIIYEYNPEWVSIDVMGENFEILNGVIYHECAVGTEESTWGAIKAIYE
jgi:hypothetical protein